jgi:predicted homoserine dehydrogenase-like protein
MIIIDKELKRIEKKHAPINVAMIGAGFFGKGVALQFATAARGMRLVAIANRTLEQARQAYSQAAVEDIAEVKALKELDARIRNGSASITEDPFLLCASKEIDVIIEATGTIQYSAAVILDAIRSNKHVIVNAELDATVGPILKVYADQHDVVYTGIDGDQPGVLMNFYRLIKGMGFEPVLCGNIKGLQDPYRNPTTQESFAKQWGQTPAMVTSFADGSKISFEQAVIANATGMSVGKRGMFGPSVPPGTPIEKAIEAFPEGVYDSESGLVDYIIGASPGPGVFIIAKHDHPVQQHYLHLYKLGEGPYYCFYRPFHLCHFEVPNAVARAALFDDATVTPAGAPTVDVVAVAKKDLKAGQEIDGVGHYMTYGICENTTVSQSEKLLPLGVAEGCVLTSDVKKDSVLTYDDVQIPDGRIIDQLIDEQVQYFKQKIIA